MLWTGTRPTAVSTLWLQIAASLVALITACILFLRSMPTAVRSSRPEYATGQWFRTARGLLAVSAGQLVLGGTTDIVIVGSLFGQVAAGQYSVAISISGAPMLFVAALSFVVTPLVSEFYHSKQIGRLQSLVRSVARVNLLVCLPLLLLLLLAGRPLLALFGPSFPAAYPVLVIYVLIVVQAVAVGGMGGYLLTLTGHQDRAAVIMVGSALSYLLLVPVLAHVFGPSGVALATLLAFLGRAVALGRECKRLVGISLWDFVRLPK
jgi:O-antigen/teichoic acid export membrane protein